MRRIFPRTNALLQPSLEAMTALPMTGFHRTRGFPAWKQYFRNTATFGILPHDHNIKLIDCKSCDRFFPCPGFTPDSLVQRTSMRVRLLGSRMCHKSHAIQLSARSVFRLRLAFLLYLSTQKDLSRPAISQTKEVSYSLYIQFRCTQKLPFYLNRKGWLVGWLQVLCQLFIFL